LLPAAALALSVVGAATPAAANGDNEIGWICTNIVRVRPGEAHYEACAQSLSDTLSHADSRAAFTEARSACLQRGYAPATPTLAVCSLDAADTSSATNADLPPDRTVAPPGGTRSYFAVSPGTAFRREQLACAELGLDPTGGAFSGCAADLHAALAAADNPMN
jgi:hypothetical protein